MFCEGWAHATGKFEVAQEFHIGGTHPIRYKYTQKGGLPPPVALKYIKTNLCFCYSNAKACIKPEYETVTPT